MSNCSEIGHKSSNVLGLKNLLGQNIVAEVHVNFLVYFKAILDPYGSHCIFLEYIPQLGSMSGS